MFFRGPVSCKFSRDESDWSSAEETIAIWENRTVTIDGSVALANGLFVKLERDFDAATSYEEIARQLRKDQDELFKILDVEEDRG